MDVPERGARIRSASDQCQGTVQWADLERERMGVRWDDGTTSTEVLGEDGDLGWELMAGTGHVCDDACVCPDHPGESVWYHRPSDTHACQRADCRYGQGLEQRPGEGHRRLRETKPPAPWEPGA